MEQVLRERFWRNKKGTYCIRNNTKKVHLVRFADDFIITADTRETAIEARELIHQFLEKRGLALSESKTTITHITNGFDFLGWEFKKYGTKLIIQPSKKSVCKITQNVKKVIRHHQASSQDVLIRKLNPMLTGWANYHQPVCASHSFKRVDHIMWDMLWRWAKRRHPKKGNRWIYEKYMKRNDKRLRFTDDHASLVYMSETPIVRRQNIRLDLNPYLDAGYFENIRSTEKAKRRIAKYGMAACSK